MTVDNLVDVMEKLTADEGRRRKVWEVVLKWMFNVFESHTPFSYIAEVYTQYTSAREKTLALSDVYVNIRPDSSWQNLVGALYGQSELDVVKRGKAFLREAEDGE